MIPASCIAICKCLCLHPFQNAWKNVLLTASCSRELVECWLHVAFYCILERHILLSTNFCPSQHEWCRDSYVWEKSTVVVNILNIILGWLFLIGFCTSWGSKLPSIFLPIRQIVWNHARKFLESCSAPRDVNRSIPGNPACGGSCSSAQRRKPN